MVKPKICLQGKLKPLSDVIIKPYITCNIFTSNLQEPDLPPIEFGGPGSGLGS